ncbi:MAG: DUF1501 domain-containing protein, partial [Deltaproteobacteria bacterium]
MKPLHVADRVEPGQVPWLCQTRRAFLGRSAMGLGSLALRSLLCGDACGGETPAPKDAGAPDNGVRHPHHAPRTKRVIFLYMAGGPSHLETFDEKPNLARFHGKPIPASVTGGQQLSPLNRCANLCVAPQAAFERCGQSGQSIADIFPNLRQVADELCIIRSMKTDTFVHDPAHTLMCTGSLLPGHPSLGSWVWYGLGSESANLPGFVLLCSYGKLFAHPLTT